jgi:Tat protein translocase TatB subunit
MFGTLGGGELLLILVIALIVFGPRKLPEIGRSVGKLMAEFRRASNDFKRTIEDEVDAERVRETQKPKTEALPAASPPVDAVPTAASAAPAPEALTPDDHAPAPAGEARHEVAAPIEPK